MSLVRILVLVFTPLLTFSQPTSPKDWGLRQFEISHKSLGDINFYIDTTNIQQKAPIILYLTGSGGYPLCFFIEGDSSSRVATTFETTVMHSTRDRYHFVVIGKPGLYFCDTISSNEKNISQLIENYQPPKLYNGQLSLEWRVKSAQVVLSFLIKKGYSNKKIIAWGFSEGGQVVPTLAIEDKRITHVVSVGGSGLNQFYDNIITTRIKIEKGELSHEQGQAEIDNLLNTYKDIYQNKNSTSKQYWGHSYKRWASFGLEDNIKNLTQLNIPIYMIAGTADENSPILGLDYVPLEFLRLGKTNLVYDVCIGCDHYQQIIDSNDPAKIGTKTQAIYVAKILQWVENN
jgi:hypothetical protein